MHASRLATQITLLSAMRSAPVASSLLFTRDARADAVAMVNDLQDRVTVIARTETRDRAILAEIPMDARVELGGGARPVAVYLRSAAEYVFAEQVAVPLAAAGPHSLAGVQPVRRRSTLEQGKGIRIHPVGISQAAIVVRSTGVNRRVKLLFLSGTRKLETPPKFRLRQIARISNYHLEFADSTSRARLDCEVEGQTDRMSESEKMEGDVSYT